MNKPTRAVIRCLLRNAARISKAPGLRYQWVERFGHKLADAQPLTGRLPNGCVVECDLRDHVARQIYFIGAYEVVEAFLFMRLLRPGMTVLDVGANIGQYTMLASSAIGPAGCVHAFEPVPVNFERLSRNVLNNALANVRLNRAAAWDESTTLTLEISEDNDVHNMGAYHVSAAAPDGRRTFTAAAVRIDDYVDEHSVSRIDVIKMDVEGSEAQALAGAVRTIQRDRPIVLMEMNRVTLEDLGNSPGRLMGLIQSWGYRVWRIGMDPSACGELDDFGGVAQVNLLLHHDGLPPQVTEGWNLKEVNRWARSGF